MTIVLHHSFPEYFARWPNVAGWYARVRARPSFAAARLVAQAKTLDQAAGA